MPGRASGGGAALDFGKGAKAGRVPRAGTADQTRLVESGQLGGGSIGRRATVDDPEGSRTSHALPRLDGAAPRQGPEMPEYRLKDFG